MTRTHATRQKELIAVNFLKTLFAGLLANVVLLFLIFGCVALTGVAMKIAQKPDVKDDSFLVLDVYGDVMAYDPPETIVSELLGDEPETLHRILANLEKAALIDSARIVEAVKKVCYK